MMVSRSVKFAHPTKCQVKTLRAISWLFCAALLPVAAQTPATIDIDITTTSPITPGFSGANSEIGFPIEDWDYRFNSLAAQVGYGWLRFPGGKDGDAYDWQTGQEVAAWV